MKESKYSICVTFYNTVEAIGFERFCEKEGIIGRLIPLPTEISAECGLAFSCTSHGKEELQEKLSSKGVAYLEIFAICS